MQAQVLAMYSACQRARQGIKSHRDRNAKDTKRNHRSIPEINKRRMKVLLDYPRALIDIANLKPTGNAFTNDLQATSCLAF